MLNRLAARCRGDYPLHRPLTTVGTRHRDGVQAQPVNRENTVRVTLYLIDQIPVDAVDLDLPLIQHTAPHLVRQLLTSGNRYRGETAVGYHRRATWKHQHHRWQGENQWSLC